MIFKRVKRKDKKRVLVTGGAGRLGITVCNTFLQNGFQVRVFDVDTARNRRNIKELDGRAEILWGDVTRPDSVRRAMAAVDAVVHMAAILPPVADEKPELAAAVNVGGTGIIVDLIKEKDKRIPLVYTSSVAVFGPNPGATRPISVDRSTPRPEGIYAGTKFQAENLIKEAGIDYVILRLTATMYPIFEVSDLKRMLTVPLDNRVEFCHLENTALAILNAVRTFNTVKGHTLVISGGSEQRMLYKDMIGAILKVLGLPLPPVRKFTRHPYYLDWYYTSKSQQLLNYQQKTFNDYLIDYARGLTRRFSPLFLPFMRYFVGPVFGRIIVGLI